MNFLVQPFTMFFDMIHSGLTAIGITSLSWAYFLDIFIFTAIIKLIILPLTISQTKSTAKMSQIQPKLKELQEKYKNDPQKLQQKQMELYKEAGANPLGGCLPMLVQFPIFMGMYYVIMNYPGFTENVVPFLWVPNLGKPDPYYILPVLSGLSTFIQGMMMTPGGSNDPSTKSTRTMNIVMAVFFTYISLKFQAALVLYWIIGNLIQMATQYFIVNRVKKQAEAKLTK